MQTYDFPAKRRYAGRQKANPAFQKYPAIAKKTCFLTLCYPFLALYGTNLVLLLPKRKDKRLTAPLQSGAINRSKMIMNKENQIRDLKYRIKRYQAMGNGVMCQSLNKELLRVMTGNATTR